VKTQLFSARLRAINAAGVLFDATCLSGVVGMAHVHEFALTRPDAFADPLRKHAMFGHMFEAALDRPTPPGIVAEKIREIIESGTQKLRHPVGPDAEAFLGWRASLTDEQWVEWGALPDDLWYARVLTDFGLDARSKRGLVTAAGGRSGV
jgi:hypothetical protein